MNTKCQPSRRHRAVLHLIGCLLSVLLFPAQGAAHEIRPAIADIAFFQPNAVITLRVNLEALVTEIGVNHDDTDQSPSAERYNALRAMPPVELEAVFRDYTSTFLKNVKVQGSDGLLISPKLEAFVIPLVGDVKIARDSVLTLYATLPKGTQSLVISWAADYGDLILRSGSEADDNAFNQYLLAGETSNLIPTGGQLKNHWLSTVKSYFVVGFIHIVPKGLDHILFVIGLFLLSPYWRAILLQVSAFTVAHTITLALGMTGMLQVSSSIVEPLIALSITVVCLENIFTSTLKRWRLVIVILFGLLHGLGFAGVLSEIGFSQGLFVASLLSFNVGVEVGQLLVILLCFLLAGWPFRAKSWYRKMISLPASVVLCVVGMVWFFQRIAI